MGIDTAVVLAAGKSTRMYPIGQHIPKPLLRIAGKSLLHWIIEGLSRSGIRKVYVVVKYKKEMVEQELEHIVSQIGIKVEAVEQGPEKGTAAALKSVSFLDEPFVLAMGDAALDWHVFRELVDAYLTFEEDVVMLKTAKDPTRFGVVETKDGRISRIEEKPKVAFSKLINAGIYVFSPNIFKEVEKINPSPRGEYEITDVLLGKRAITTERFLIDVGYPWSLLEALEFYLGGQSIIQGTVEGKVVGPVYIDKNSEIKEGAVVGPLVQLESSYVGPTSYVGRSILWNSTLQGHNYVELSILSHSYFSPSVVVESRAKQEIVVDTGQRIILTGLNKLGCISNHSEVGANSVVMPGTVLDKTVIKEGSIVKGFVRG